jgi:DNA-binding transcriptional regulator LsrR (DeoR family)
MSAHPWIEQQVTFVYVAIQNLAEGRPLGDIAREIGVSRFTAARMVRRARELGLIEVRVSTDDPVDVALSMRLAQRFDLEAAIVVASPASPQHDVHTALTAAAARFLVEHTSEDDVIGVCPGRTIVALSRQIASLPWADIVQLTGVCDPDVGDGLDAILSRDRASGGASYPLHTSLFVGAHERAALLRHPTNARTIRRFAAVTTAYLTLGGWPASSLLATQVDEAGEMDSFVDLGVVADVGTTLLDTHGQVISGMEDRLFGIDDTALRRIPRRVIVGGGAAKGDALRAALRSGIATVVITDAHAARSALA